MLFLLNPPKDPCEKCTCIYMYICVAVYLLVNKLLSYPILSYPIPSKCNTHISHGQTFQHVDYHNSPFGLLRSFLSNANKSTLSVTRLQPVSENCISSSSKTFDGKKDISFRTSSINRSLIGYPLFRRSSRTQRRTWVFSRGRNGTNTLTKCLSSSRAFWSPPVNHNIIVFKSIVNSRTRMCTAILPSWCKCFDIHVIRQNMFAIQHFHLFARVSFMVYVKDQESSNKDR